jgi:Domain of unknown function (DUF5615)
MAKFYANENFRLPTVEALKQLGHDVLTSFDAGMANKGIPDEMVLAFAIQENRIVLTFNRKHFIRLHRLDSNHAGLIVCTEDNDSKALAGRIHEAVTNAGESVSGQLIRVNRPNVL